MLEDEQMMPTNESLYKDLLVVDGLFPREMTEEHIDEILDGGVDVVQNSLVTGGADFVDAIDAIKRTQVTLAGKQGVRQIDTLSGLHGSDDDLKVVFGFQNSTPFERGRAIEENVALFDRLGVRFAQVTYNKRNYAGDGCSERTDSGLSDFGVELIEALEAHDILVDLSHAGPRTAAEAAEVAEKPVVLSHSNAEAVHSHPRNVSDDLIRTVAETGGTVGINSLGPAVSPEDESTIADYVDHIEYVQGLVGIEHVALGPDIGDSTWDTSPKSILEDPRFELFGNRRVTGLESPTGISLILDEMLERGFDESEIRAVFGENLLRVFEATWPE